MKRKIKKKIKSVINIIYIKILNDNKIHKLKKLITNHYRIIIVSHTFLNLKLTDRHKIIYKIFNKYIPNIIYSIQLYTYNLHEWNIKKRKYPPTLCIKKNKILC